jgi:hypothetical protein
VHESTGLDKGKPLKKSLIQLQPARDLNPEPPEFEPDALSYASTVLGLVTGGRPRRRGGVPRGAKRQGGEAPRGAKRHGTMESSRGHRASRSDDGGELEQSDEGWLDDGASAGTPC